MEVELAAYGMSEEDTLDIDEENVGSAFEGERCGICMEIIIDRGVLDCCQHLFCFVCIDNWATITNLCPLCQNEFQLITCIPVYDTIGSNKVDDATFLRDDDWCIEGKSNTLSFPSYYIDENAVICLDGDGCKIRSGSAAFEEVSNLDTSIACDSCDLWYHAFCVGFDTDGTSENTWLCPRCVVDNTRQKSAGTSINNHGPENGGSEPLVEPAFSGKVSVSVADAGETAIVVSMQWTEEPNKKSLSNLDTEKDLKIGTSLSICDVNSSLMEMSSKEMIGHQGSLEKQELELSLSLDTSFDLPSNSFLGCELKTTCADEAMNEPGGFDESLISPKALFDESCVKELCESQSNIVEDMNCDVTEAHEAGNVQQLDPSGEPLLSVDKIELDANKDIVANTTLKREFIDYSANNGENEAEIESKDSVKKDRTKEKVQVIPLKVLANESVLDASEKFPTSVCRDDKMRHNLEKQNVTPDIMSIVQGTNHRPLNGLACQHPADEFSNRKENAAGLRVKKIMRRVSDDMESSIQVQKLRKEIREFVRNKSSANLEQNLFDPKLLSAFRAAVAGPTTEPVNKVSSSVVKLKKSTLQKGKIRENLTKKIYGTSSGKRRRAWDRDCEIEFWKHRCMRATKPEKIDTLKSVLDLLRKSTDNAANEQNSKWEVANPVLSRLYLADNSVFPRKNDIKPVSAIQVDDNHEQNKEHVLREKSHKLSLDNCTVKTALASKVLSQVGTPSHGKKENNCSLLCLKGEANSGKVHPKVESQRLSLLGSSKPNSQKEMIGKSADIKSDKRKWALEVLARKTAVEGKSASHEKQEDIAVLKGNYPLLAQLPVDMRPVLAAGRRNKIPVSVRQAQLYRLAEHFLQNTNLPVICRTAVTELAVADAVNIEKEIADRSNSKLVYVNLCSQELLQRSGTSTIEPNSSPHCAVSIDGSEQVTGEISADPVVEEALKAAGLLSDTPPNSPHSESKVPSEKDDHTKHITEEGPENVFEMESNPELDIYGDFDYDLEDEDYIGVGTVSKLPSEEGELKMKVVLSTLNSGPSNYGLDFEDSGKLGIVVPHESTSSLVFHTDTDVRSSSMENRTDKSCLPSESLHDESVDPSLAECEELYGPDKEQLVKKFEVETSKLLSGLVGAEASANNIVPGKNENHENNEATKGSGFHSQRYADNVVGAPVGRNSCGEILPNHSQTAENVPREKYSSTNTHKQSDGNYSVCKKVEAYIKEHIRPLCKSGVITAAQYKWAVVKTTDKVMKYHLKATNANFLVKEGEKVKKLAEQYVEAAQQMEQK